MDRLFALRAPVIIVFNVLWLHSTGYILQRYFFSDSPLIVWFTVAVIDMYYGFKCGCHVQNSFKDQMTGLYNRSFLLIFMAEALEGLRLKKEPITLLMIDIDNFKAINDEYGHLEGDLVIKQIANSLKRWTRKTDCAVRWGGEEFIMVLPSTTQEEGQKVAERLRQYVADYELCIKSNVIKVTVSIGLTCVTELIDSDCLIERADKALYEAKQNRNSVAVYFS